MSAPAMTPSSTPTAWLVVLLLLPVAFLNYLDRQMLAAMHTSLMGSIPSIRNEENWGFMLAQFKWVYAILSPVGGYVADRFSRRLTIRGSLFAWSAATWWTGNVTTYSELLWARSFMGVSEALYIPAALALITDHHAGHTRSRAVGLHQMALYFGMIAGGFGGVAADAPGLGWRFAFDACGIVGVGYAFILVFLPLDPARRQAGAVGPRVSVLAAGKELFRNLSFLVLVLYFTLPAIAGWVVRDWMPSILKQQFNLGQGQASVAATLYWQVAAIGGAVGGGWLADRWMRRSKRGRIYISSIGMCLIVPAIFGVGDAGSLAAAVTFLIVFGLGCGFFDCNNMPILSQIVRPRLRATGYGIMNFVSISCGGLADWGVGFLRDRKVPLNMIFGLFAGAAVLSALLVLLVKPRANLSDLDQNQ